MEHMENMVGWNAITKTFEKLYPEQKKPIENYTPIISSRFEGGGIKGGPLDCVSVFDGGEYYHLVSFGLSDIYEKESENDLSGYGFELTLKLKKESIQDPESEFKNIVNIFAMLANATYERGSIFKPNEYICTGQKSGMDAKCVSKITGFVTVLDQAGEIDTDNGKVQFIQLVGATDDELQQIMEKQTTVEALISKLGHTLTDYKRDSML